MSFNSVAIQVAELGKCYQIYNRPQDRLKQAIIPRLQTFVRRSISTYYHEFWALRNISFEIHKGETVGIVGRNGSGKSTLMHILGALDTPTSGTYSLRRRPCQMLRNQGNRVEGRPSHGAHAKGSSHHAVQTRRPDNSAASGMGIDAAAVAAPNQPENWNG